MIAVTAVFAVVLAIGTFSGALNRDGVWVVESIHEESIWYYGEPHHGVSKLTGLPTNGAAFRYIARLRDGDRIRSVSLGDDLHGLDGPLPDVGDTFVFADGNPSVNAGLQGNVTLDAADNNAFAVPSLERQGYNPIFNILFAFVISLFLILSFSMVRRFFTWIPKMIADRVNRRQTVIEHLHRTRIV